jgi:hypothetical protein
LHPPPLLDLLPCPRVFCRLQLLATKNNSSKRTAKRTYEAERKGEEPSPFSLIQLPRLIFSAPMCLATSICYTCQMWLLDEVGLKPSWVQEASFHIFKAIALQRRFTCLPTFDPETSLQIQGELSHPRLAKPFATLPDLYPHCHKYQWDITHVRPQAQGQQSVHQIQEYINILISNACTAISDCYNLSGLTLSLPGLRFCQF